MLVLTVQSGDCTLNKTNNSFKILKEQSEF